MMQNTFYRAVVIFTSMLLLSCGGTQAVAPVISKEPGQRPPANTAQPRNQPGNKQTYHQVRPGETLYSIAWSYGYDPKLVAEWNNIKPPYRIYTGQSILVVPPRAAVIVKRPLPPPAFPSTTSPATGNAQSPPFSSAPAAPASAKEAALTDSVKAWKWPAQGEVIQSFSTSEKGLSIAGKEAQPIFAAAAGSVVYRGSGLIGLGELVIIKHDKSFLSAYAHNKKILVNEGDKVALGQPIAEMGKTGAERVKLYFEIRKDGKPVDPLLYLPRKN